MNIEQAIAILTEYQGKLPRGLSDAYLDAIKLGTEALKEVRKARYGDPALDGELLPGETED